MTDQGAEENEVSAVSTPQKHEGKAATIPSPKLQNFGHRSRCEQIHYAPCVEGRSGGEVLQDAASPGTYGQSCGHESRKMQGNTPGDGRLSTAAEPRVYEREENRHPAGGTPAK